MNRIGLMVLAICLMYSGVWAQSASERKSDYTTLNPGNQGDTIDLPAAESEGRRRAEALQEKYRNELKKYNLPLPENLDINAIPLGVMQVIDKYKGEPCEMMNEIRLHLGEKPPKTNLEIAGALAGIFVIPDADDIGRKLAKIFAKNLVPTAKIYDIYDNAGNVMKLIDTEYRAGRLHGQYLEAVGAYRISKGWDMARLQKETKSIDANVDSKIAEVEKLENELRTKLMREYPDVSIYGPPFVGSSKVPSESLEWQRYAERIEPIQRQYEAEINSKLREIAGLELKKNFLEKYRKPLIEKPCEYNDPPQLPPPMPGGGNKPSGKGAGMDTF